MSTTTSQKPPESVPPPTSPNLQDELVRLPGGVLDGLGVTIEIGDTDLAIRVEFANRTSTEAHLAGVLPPGGASMPGRMLHYTGAGGILKRLQTR